jgi:hypothetical protein
MLINKTRTNLTSDEYQQLAKLANGFYDNIPDGLTLHGDWAANDQSRTFALIESEDPQLIDQIRQPFRNFVDIEVIPVTAVTGWGKR